MIEDRKTIALPPEQVTALVQTALRARQNGDQRAARTLLRALAARQPNVAQIWLALATVAETRDEQRTALERAIALDPENEFAQRALARFAPDDSHVSAPADHSAGTPRFSSRAARPAATLGSDAVAPGPAARRPAVAPTTAVTGAAAPDSIPAAAPITTGAEASPAAPPARPAIALADTEALAPAPALTPAEPADQARDIRWPLYVIVGVAVLAVVIAALLIRPSGGPNTEEQPITTPALPGAATAVAQSAATVARPAAGGDQAQPGASATDIPPATAAATNAPPTSAPRPTAVPQPPRPTLAPGEVVISGQWHAVLIRPDDARRLDGAIGSLQPRGRFVLALLAIGNDGTAPARLPTDLFTIVDAQGQRYQPLPAASTEYLNSYSRGQHGDLSMEDPIPSDGGNKSIPIIFDVPATARGLYLLVGDAGSGWAIGE